MTHMYQFSQSMRRYSASDPDIRSFYNSGNGQPADDLFGKEVAERSEA